MRILAIIPGRFHPFHPGHAASFWEMASLFGVENTMLAISMKQEAPRSPFSPFDRAKMAMSLGIPKENIMLIKQPYSTKEYAEKLKKQDIDPNETAIVFGVSQKDMEEDPRFDFEPLQDGSPGFYQPYQEGEMANMMTHGYVMSTRTVPFKIAGHTIKDASDIRTMYSKGNENVKNRVLADLYGIRAAKVLKPIFDSSLGLMESIKAYYDQIKTRLVEADSGQKRKFAKILSENTNLPNENSLGQPIANNPESLRNFWNWFGNSKIVDEQGRPLVVYHGTGEDFTEFDDAKTGSNDRGLWGRGHYFTTVTTTANSYALRSDSARVLPVYVSIQHPLILTTGKDLVTRMPDGTSARELVGQNLDGSKIKAIAQSNSHDGVIQIRPNGLIGDLVAYSSRQVKSSIGNTGNYSTDNSIVNEAKEEFDTSKVWYHGTTSPTDFKQFKIGKNGVDELGKGIYVTSDPDMAEAWAGRVGAGGRIMPLYVRKGELIDDRLVNDNFIKNTIIPRLKQIYPPESPEYKVHMNAHKLHDTKPFSEWTPEDKVLYNKGNEITWLGYLVNSEESLYDHIKNTCNLLRARDSNELTGINRWLSMVGYVGKYNPNSQIPGQLCVFKPSDLKSAIGNNGKYKGATLVNEEFKDSMLGHHNGQSDMRLSLIQDGDEVGYIDYVIYDDEISISMIEVPKDQRRKGYARELLKKLQAEYPDTEIQWGMMTDDGAKLRSQTTYEVPDEEVITKQEKLQRITQKIERLKQFAEKYGNLKNKTDSQYQKFMKVIEPWNELSDEQDDLERELYDKKPSKTFIKK